MKQYTRHITVEEAEQLCRLYIDCQLSVLEETELEYVLMQSGLDSPLISETRTMMGISRSVNFQMPKKHLFLTWGWHVAACVAILIGSIALLQNHITNETDCIAYVEGTEISGEKAKVIAEADVARMEQFMRTVETQRATEQAKVEQFMNHNYIITVHSQCCQHLCQSSQVECGEPLRRQIQQQ